MTDIPEIEKVSVLNAREIKVDLSDGRPIVLTLDTILRTATLRNAPTAIEEPS